MRTVLLLAVGLVLLAAVGAAGLTGWRYWERHRTVDPTTALTSQCDEVPPGSERITLTADDGQVLGAALVGPEDAEVGVVLRQGASQKICEWLPWAGEVSAATGARVLLFDRRGRGSSPGEDDLSAEPADTVLAVQRLGEEGVDTVALVASSMGNSIMFSTLPRLATAPCAVVSVSPVLVSSDGNGVVDGSRLEELPDHVWVAWESQNPAIESTVELIRRAAADQGRAEPHLLPVDTMDHSRQLVLNHGEVRDFLLEAVSSCADRP